MSTPLTLSFPVPPTATVTVALLRSLAAARSEPAPFRHWLLEAPLPAATIAAVAALPFAPPVIGDTFGKRETHNSTRLFFGAPQRAEFPVCDMVASALQDRAVIGSLEACCDIALDGAFLRIEYCQDCDGFWLEPHTDIGAKLFTMLIYLSEEEGCASWGTDLMTQAGEVLATVPYRADTGLIFIPGHDTWHGFRKRPIRGIRRSLIVNYVKPEWRSRHELAFPETPVV